MRITRLELKNWRNFQDVDIKLQKRAFLLGPNAAGKSNMLDALRFMKDLAIDGGGLQKAVSDRGGVSRIRCLSARRYSDISISLDLGDDIDCPEWAYRIQFSQDNRSRPILKKEEVKRLGKVILNRPDKDDMNDEERLTQTHLEQISANKEFRDIARQLSEFRYLHIVPQLVRDPDRSVGRANDPFGGDFLEQLAKTQKNQTGTFNSRMKKIHEALKIAVPQLKDLELERDEKGTPHLIGLYEHWRPNAGKQNESQFSDGTLRLLGLLWAALEGKGVLLLEEPELSLHSEIVKRIPQMFARIARVKNRQIIVSSHSTDLMADSNIAPDEVFLLIPGIEGTVVQCVNENNEIRALAENGIPLSDIVTAKTAPRSCEQLQLLLDAR